MISHKELELLNSRLEGNLFFDELMRTLYATDASVYKMMPLAVAIPKTKNAIKALIAFANKQNTSLIILLYNTL